MDSTHQHQHAAEVAALVEAIVSDVAPDLTSWLPLIGIVAGVDLPSTPEVDILDPEVRRARLESVTSQLLGRLLTEPIVFVFNDLQLSFDFVHPILDGRLRRF